MPSITPKSLLQSSFGGKPPAPDAGRKMVCLDDRFNIQPGNCVVFSFGVGNEWSFEDDFDKFGCRVSSFRIIILVNILDITQSCLPLPYSHGPQVYAYDPTMGKKDHQRSKNVKFFAKGIANYKGTKNIGMGEKWSVKEVRWWMCLDWLLKISHVMTDMR